MKSNRKYSIIMIILNILFFWILYNPTIAVGQDELYQYYQVLNNRFSDWYPPFMSIVTNWFISLKIPFKIITLCQCFLFFFGIMFLIERMLNLIIQNKKNRNLIQFITILIMVSPFSPLPYKTMYWSIDTWFTISFIYLIINVLDLYEIINNNNNDNNKYYYKVFLISFTSATCMHLRHNSIILAPISFVAIYFLSKNKHNYYQNFLLGSLPVYIFLLISIGINKNYQIKKDYHFNSIMFLDIIGLMVDNPDLVNEFPYVKSTLKPFYSQYYMHGNVAPLIDLEPRILNDSYKNLARKENLKLISEYKKMLFNYPIQFIIIKIKAWLNLIKINGYELSINYHEDFSLKKYVNLSRNQTFEGLRSLIHKLDHHIYSQMMMIKYTLRGNTIWFLLNIIFLIQTIFNQSFNNSKKLIFILLLSFTLFYYLSYLVANPGGGYRYVYPSIIILQIFSIISFLKSVLRENNKANSFWFTHVDSK